MSETATPPRKQAVTVVGIVTSDKRDKSRTVAVELQKVHPKYGKRLRREAKYQVHDETNQSGMGDRVEIAPCRPLSKTKSWRLVRVIEKAPAEVSHQQEVPGQETPEADGE
ncbi:MAG: 30S ribosomal protein S17 [Planctomycetota bacterium]